MFLKYFSRDKPVSSIFANFLSCKNCCIISYAFCVTAHFIREFCNTTKNICILINPASEQEFGELAGFATCAIKNTVR